MRSLVFFLYNLGGLRPFRILGPFEGMGPAILAVLAIGALNLVFEASSSTLDALSLALGVFAFLYVVALVATDPGEA